MTGPLEGLKVLDLTWALSGPFATMVLCDLGAEVTKIERPRVGDRARLNDPKVGSISAYLFSLNRGKKSVVIDLGQEKGKKLFLKLVRRYDVVAENFVPGTMARLGLGYETLRKHNPRLIYAACSGFGQTGPDAQKPALDVIVQGRGGLMSITGEEDGPPARVGVSIGDISAGLFLAAAILAAVYERIRSGQGRMIDISMMDSVVALEENAFVRYFTTGEVPRRLGVHPYTLYPWVRVSLAAAGTGCSRGLFSNTRGYAPPKEILSAFRIEYATNTGLRHGMPGLLEAD